MRRLTHFGWLALTALVLAGCGRGADSSAADDDDSSAETDDDDATNAASDDDDATSGSPSSADDDDSAKVRSGTGADTGDGESAPAGTTTGTTTGTGTGSGPGGGSTAVSGDDSSGESEDAHSSSSMPASGGAPSTPVVSGSAGTTGAAGSAAVAAAGAPEEPEVPLPDPSDGFQAGSLTAGAWDDNLNYEWFKSYRKSLVDEQTAGLLPITLDDHDEANALAEQARVKKAKLDVALVIDTTGSMSDELSYLQTEFLALSNTIENTYADSEQRWSLVLYRDEGDAYVVRDFDFTSDVNELRDRLQQQSADGGGDMPEAPDQALDRASQLQWRTGSDTARLLFWVADAPHHEQNARPLAGAIVGLQQADVHIYPVAGSGVDPLAEYAMRVAAQLTLGRYLFLTDDSGFGGSHMAPTIPCYYVTGLDDAILRMVALEMTGKAPLPKAADVVRTVGEPADDGVCELESGDTAQAI
ncbi:MAG: VWA domain-containing protein [Polyangiaceae bacterium]|nr:VWA domain-containing protein [Polyangiaceae bacterium]